MFCGTIVGLEDRGLAGFRYEMWSESIGSQKIFVGCMYIWKFHIAKYIGDEFEVLSRMRKEDKFH